MKFIKAGDDSKVQDNFTRALCKIVTQMIKNNDLDFYKKEDLQVSNDYK